jgi:glycosyltransferase involved in cell wall biosynthesis
MKKLAVITTHPIQYNAPLFKLLTERNNIAVRVFYTWEKGAEGFDVGFGKSFTWDIPLLDGYDHTFVSNNGTVGKGFWDVKNPGLIDCIGDWEPDAVLVYGWNFYSHLQAMRFFKGKLPVWFRGDSTLITERKWYRSMMRGLSLRWVYSNIDLALYVGKENKRYFLEHGLKEHQLCFVPHAVDNHRFSELTEAQVEYKEELLRSLRLKDDTKNIVFAGKFQQQKNLELLIQAFIKLNAEDWNLVLVGNGELEEELRRLVNQHNKIHFLPFQNQSLIPAIYKLGPLFCMPSRNETWGLAVNEAMAAGRAILASDKVGCSPDLVKEGENGFVFRSGDLADLLQKLKLATQSDLNKMGNRSREIISRWSFDTQANAIETLLNHTHLSVSKISSWK